MTLRDLLAQRVVVLDGAMGTELQARGLAPGESGDWWSVAHPEKVKPVHEAYRDAGSDVVTSNSFGANRWVLERYGFADQVEAVNRAAAALAVEAAGEGHFVFGDIGPSGVLIEPLGPATVDELRREFGRQASALLAGGAHGIIVETMSDLQEASVAVAAAREAGADIVVGSMTFSPLPNGRMRTMMGVSPEDAARELHAAGATIVGVNCGSHMGFDACAEVVRLMRSVCNAPVLAMPNAGHPRWEDGRAIYDLGPADFAEGMRAVLAAGATLVGGCCGTTPAHIAALRRSLGV
jgi:5-methyltetrahydrofolate--homocysteine methyltransferase